MITKNHIKEKAKEYANHTLTSEVATGQYDGFIAGANYVMKQLILSGVIKSVCLENNRPIDCNQFLALGNCEKCKYFK